MLSVSAPAKLILSGEHAVVYGYPAIATAIDLRMTCTYDLSETIRSDIPIGGLGSSSALCVCRAVSALVLDELPLSLPNICARATDLDRQFHTNPSGLDTTICTYGGTILFRKCAPNFPEVNHLEPKTILSLYLLNTGRPNESTADMVNLVAEKYKTQPQKITSIFRNIKQCTSAINDYLQGPSLQLDGIIRQNERLLEELEVVSNKTQNIIRNLESIGASAKITGAGGFKNGSGMVIVYHPDPEKLLDFAAKNNLELTSVRLDQNGVSYSASI